MAVNLVNAQFDKFVAFASAQAQAGNASAVARDGNAANGAAPLAGRTIVTAAGGDKGPLRRSQADQDANDAVRTLFRQTIADMFCGEAKIPESVRKAMNLGDYGRGRPLTARRIIAVKTAIDRLYSPNIEFNNALADAVRLGRFNRLPDELLACFDEVADDLRARFGTAVVPQGAKLWDILNPTNVASELKELCNAMSARGEVVDFRDVANLYGDAALKRRALIVAGDRILAQVRAHNPDFSFTELSLGTLFCTRHADFFAEIVACRNPGEIDELFRRREADIGKFADAAIRANAAAKPAAEKAIARISEALGLDPGFAATHVPTGKLAFQAKELASQIMRGDAPGCMEDGYDVEAAYDAIVSEFVQKRIDACAAIDSLDLPPAVKNGWKAAYTGLDTTPVLTPAQLLEVANAVDADRLVNALSPNLPMKIAVETLHSVTNAIVAKVNQVTGNPRFFAKVGVDDELPLFQMLITFAKAKNPALAAAVDAAAKTFLEPAHDFCAEGKDANTLARVANFIKMLAASGGAAHARPLVDADKFAALVRSETEAALAECGVANAKVLDDVRKTMLARGRDALKNAPDLKTLSDFAASVRAAAASLAKPLDDRMRAIVAKHSPGIPQEALPLLERLVNLLDWSDGAAAASEEIVKNYAGDMKTWRNVAPGSPDSKGLEAVFQRRMNDYLKAVLQGETGFNTTDRPGLFQTFLEDLPRANYVFNGTPAPGKAVQTRIVPFENAIKDPAKRKVVSVMINQQIWGEYTTSVANRLPFASGNGVEEEPSATIP